MVRGIKLFKEANLNVKDVIEISLNLCEIYVNNQREY